MVGGGSKKRSQRIGSRGGKSGVYDWPWVGSCWAIGVAGEDRRPFVRGEGLVLQQGEEVGTGARHCGQSRVREAGSGHTYLRSKW